MNLSTRSNSPQLKRTATTSTVQPAPERQAVRRPRLHPRAPRFFALALLLLALLAACSRVAPNLGGNGPELSGLEVSRPTPHELVFSAVQGSRTEAQVVSVRNTADAPLELSEIALVGPDKDAFALGTRLTLPLVIEPQGDHTLSVHFAPQGPGSRQASLQLVSNDPAQDVVQIGLYGLGARGEQGKFEPSLHEIVTTLGYRVDVGGTELVLSTTPEAIGDEVAMPLFERASRGPVRLTPVARYGPEEVTPFGFFTLEGEEETQVQRREVGRVASADAQRLLPPLASGGDTFDPGEATFGVYARAGGREQYSLDALNRGGLDHALRVYPLKDRAGQPVPNSYLIGLEEARNGDYQDAVFVISNVKPATAALPTQVGADGWTSLFNGRNLDGWYTYLPSKGKNNDPEGVFKVENGMLHILDVEQKGDREFGYLATEQEFENYHLRLEYRWGTKRFAPRDRAKRDSGVIYHVTGRDKVWPPGVEYQIQEYDTGDFWMIGGTTLSTTVASRRDLEPRYRQNGEPYVTRPGDFVRLVKDSTHDSKGGWNTAEIIVSGDTAVHIINGEVNNRAYSLFQPGPNGDPVALSKGRILLQAEGAEVFYRNVEIRPQSHDESGKAQ